VIGHPSAPIVQGTSLSPYTPWDAHSVTPFAVRWHSLSPLSWLPGPPLATKHPQGAPLESGRSRFNLTLGPRPLDKAPGHTVQLGSCAYTSCTAPLKLGVRELHSSPEAVHNCTQLRTPELLAPEL
jgi:hypothetical protein